MIILAWVTLYKHSSPHFHHNKALSTVCEQCEAPLQRDRPYFCHFILLWNMGHWVTCKHRNWNKDWFHCEGSETPPQKHPLITEVMISILYPTNWFLLHSDVQLHSTIDSNTTVATHRIGRFSQCFPRFVSTVQTHYAHETLRLWAARTTSTQCTPEIGSYNVQVLKSDTFAQIWDANL